MNHNENQNFCNELSDLEKDISSNLENPFKDSREDEELGNNFTEEPQTDQEMSDADADSSTKEIIRNQQILINSLAGIEIALKKLQIKLVSVKEKSRQLSLHYDVIENRLDYVETLQRIFNTKSTSIEQDVIVDITEEEDNKLDGSKEG